ncbi:DUF1294 domain-containing protein [uncultured Roseobacter sp.]|uniref:DUF1294 domain-containing protein n=1 Tax=uncultured Roseobacter sp. TaxID=114847 RepID=UPI00262B97E2|nr:DUF1294 domain-containing protein [uncultured Roseobacter sp.]
MSCSILVSAGLVIINLVSFVAFRADKIRATDGGRRVPERSLLTLAFLGGWIGAKIAQRMYRHKTTKQPFRLMLDLVPVAWLGVIFILIAATAMPDVDWPGFQMSSDRETPRFFQRVGN